MYTGQSDRGNSSNESPLLYCIKLRRLPIYMYVYIGNTYIQSLYVTIGMLKSLFLFLMLACHLAYISQSCSSSHQFPDILFPMIPGVLLTEPFLSDSWNLSASLLETLWGASCSPRSGRLSAHETVVTGCHRYESGSSLLFSGVEVFCHTRVDSTGNYLLQIQGEERERAIHKQDS